MTKWHLFSKGFIVIGVLSIVCLLANIFIAGTDNAGFDALLGFKGIIQSVCYFVSPLVVLALLIASVTYGIESRKTSDKTISTIAMEFAAIMVINIVLMLIPGNNMFEMIIEYIK